jgi:hypothetical protein
VLLDRDDVGQLFDVLFQRRILNRFTELVQNDSLELGVALEARFGLLLERRDVLNSRSALNRPVDLRRHNQKLSEMPRHPVLDLL